MRSPPVLPLPPPPPPAPSATPQVLPCLWTQLPYDAQQALAAQLAVLRRRRWTQQDPAPLGGRPHDRD